jgi:hypothetical protein
MIEFRITIDGYDVGWGGVMIDCSKALIEQCLNGRGLETTSITHYFNVTSNERLPTLTKDHPNGCDLGLERN